MSRKRSAPSNGTGAEIAASVHKLRSADLQSLVFDTLGYSRTAFKTKTASKLKVFVLALMEFARTTTDTFTGRPSVEQRTTAKCWKYSPPEGALKYFEVRRAFVVVVVFVVVVANISLNTAETGASF
jgi:hypothetical protein